MPPSIADICNYRQAGPRLATSGQPREEELAAIAAAGYEVIINLALHDDPRYSLPYEAASVRAQGLTYVHIPVRFDALTDGDLDAFFAAMERFGDAQLWLHCAVDKRVSAFLGLYRYLRQGWPPAQAFALSRDVWEPDAVWSAFIARELACPDAGGA